MIGRARASPFKRLGDTGSVGPETRGAAEGPLPALAGPLPRRGTSWVAGGGIRLDPEAELEGSAGQPSGHAYAPVRFHRSWRLDLAAA